MASLVKSVRMGEVIPGMGAQISVKVLVREAKGIREAWILCDVSFYLLKDYNLR